jgi:hypothetical protein
LIINLRNLFEENLKNKNPETKKKTMLTVVRPFKDPREVKNSRMRERKKRRILKLLYLEKLYHHQNPRRQKVKNQRIQRPKK